MAQCNVCGKENDHTFELWLGGEAQVFDSVERAFYAVAPICSCCGGRVVGKGIEAAGSFFCCGHCAREYVSIRMPEYFYQLAPHEASEMFSYR